MKPKLILVLALVLIGGLFGGLQANAGINVPIVAAPKMRVCQEAKINDLGFWDDVFRFENSDFIVLRRGDELFSYSLVASDLKRIKTISHMTSARIINGVVCGKHQWLFCGSGAMPPFAIDLSTGKKVQFDIPEVGGSTIHAIITTGYKGGTVIEIYGDGVAGWPRDGNRPIYFWMSLESGRMAQFPTGWDLSYFSADQRTAVFENLSTNDMEYRPWVSVNMETGTVIDKLPDQTKVLWSEPTMFFGEDSVNRFNNRQNVWQLRTPRTPMKLKLGRGFCDDTFAGLSVDGIACPLSMTNSKLDRCVDAKAAGNLAAFLLEPDGGGEKSSLWVTRLKENETPKLLANNCRFEMLGEHRCALIGRNDRPESLSESVVYDADSQTAWNIFDGVSLGTNTMAAFDGDADKRRAHAGLQPYSGCIPTISLRLVSGFGSTRFPAQVLFVYYSTKGESAHMLLTPAVRQYVLLTAQGNRYQIKLPNKIGDLASAQHFWLHNSGTLIMCQSESASNNSPKGQFHLLLAKLLNQP